MQKDILVITPGIARHFYGALQAKPPDRTEGVGPYHLPPANMLVPPVLHGAGGFDWYKKNIVIPEGRDPQGSGKKNTVIPV